MLVRDLNYRNPLRAFKFDGTIQIVAYTAIELNIINKDFWGKNRLLAG